MTARPWISGRDYTWAPPAYSSEGLTSAEISRPDCRSPGYQPHGRKPCASATPYPDSAHAAAAAAPPLPTTPPRSNHSRPAPPPRVHGARSRWQAVPVRAEKAPKPAMLIFYRGGWCPYCNAHLKDLRTAVPQVAALGLRRVVPEHRPSRDPALEPQGARRLPPVVRQRRECRARVRHRLPHGRCDLRQIQGYGLDLEETQGAKHHELPVPAVFIVDRTGKIRFAHTNADYTSACRRAEVVKARAALRSDS